MEPKRDSPWGIFVGQTTMASSIPLGLYGLAAARYIRPTSSGTRRRSRA